MARSSGKRGFTAIDNDEHRRTASEGGKASGGNFAHDQQRAIEVGKQRAATRSREQKARGSRNSHDEQ